MEKDLVKTNNKSLLDRMVDDHILPVLVCALAVPLSLSLWLLNVGYTHISVYSLYEDPPIVHPTRWLVASFITVFITIYGLKKKSLSVSGAIFGFFVGMILTISSYSFFACLFTFFVTSSKATKFRGSQKAKLEEVYKEGGQRTWVHVLCNGGVAAQLGLLYLLDVGCSERPINFNLAYRPSWLSIAILGSFACCNGDTWASELATVLTKKDPYLITTFKRVPRGTNGGITILGVLLSALGGLVVGIADYLVVIYFSDKDILISSPPQHPIIIIGMLSGLIGSLIDSILGATLQYSGIDSSGKIVSSSGKGIKHISGRRILDNHSVNLISSMLTAFIMPYVAIAIWPY